MFLLSVGRSIPVAPDEFVLAHGRPPPAVVVEVRLEVSKAHGVVALGVRARDEARRDVALGEPIANRVAPAQHERDTAREETARASEAVRAGTDASLSMSVVSAGLLSLIRHIGQMHLVSSSTRVWQALHSTWLLLHW